MSLSSSGRIGWGAAILLAVGLIWSIVTRPVAKLQDVPAEPRSKISVPPAAPTSERVQNPIPVTANATSNPVSPTAAPTARPSGDQNPGWEDQRLLVESVIAKEPVDNAWAKPAKGMIREGLDKIATDKDSVTSLECRSTLCRAEVRHDTGPAFKNFLREVSGGNGKRKLPWLGEYMGGQVSAEKDGTTVSVIFFAREGAQMPHF